MHLDVPVFLKLLIYACINTIIIKYSYINIIIIKNIVRVILETNL